MTTTATQAVHRKRRRTALSTLQAQLRIGTALAGVVMPLSMPGVALAADECGVPLGGVVTCSAAGNPYASGIEYTAGGQDLTFVLTADGLVHTTAPGIGVSVSGAGGVLSLDLQGRVVTDAAGATGVSVDANATNTIVNVNSITSAGAGLNVVGDTSISVTADTVESVGQGIVAMTYDGPVSVDARSITTTGNNAWGIDAFSNGFGTVTVTGDGRIETRGNVSHGIGANTGGAVDIDVNSVATFGADSHGIYANSIDAGLVTVNAASVATEGARSNGVLATSVGGDVDVEVGDASTIGDDATAVRASSVWGNVGVATTGLISTTGSASHGVRASSTYGGASATNSGTMTTTGNDSAGMFVEGGAGAVSATNSGSVGTGGDRSIAIFATSSQGDVTVGNTGVISTTGSDSHGINAVSIDGAVTVTNGGTVTTTGDDAVAIAAKGGSKDVRVTNAGTLGTTGANAEAIRAESDQGDVVIGNSGNVSTTGARSTAIFTRTGGGDITVTSTGRVTAADGIAVAAQSTLGNIEIDMASAAAGGVRGTAIYGFSTEGNVDVRIGSASTTGQDGYVIDLRSIDGNLTLVADEIRSQGAFANGVFATTDTGRIDLRANSIVTQGEESRGVLAETTSGPIAIDVGSVATSGDLADAILATSATGAVTVNAHGTISTAGWGSNGVKVETDGDVDITVADINTTGRGGNAVTANSGSGNLTVVANGTITTRGKSAVGIGAYSDSGDIDVTAGNIDTARDDAHGIEAYSTSGKVKIVDTGTIAVRGENAHGIVAGGGAGTTVIADSVSVSGYRADGIVLSGDGGIELALRNLHVTGDGSDGILADTASGAVRIDVGNVHAADGRAISAETGNGDTSLRISGKVQGHAEEIVYAASTGDTRIDILAGGEVSGLYGTRTAIVARGANVLIDNAGILSATSVPTVMVNSGTVRLINSGTFIGGVSFDAGDDLIVNSGRFELSGTSEFWDGNDLFVNSGVVSLRDNATLANLERFDNSGLVTLANNRAGEVLTMSGDYVGINGRLALDIDTASAGTSDLLVIGGSASGTTTIAINSVRGGALLPGRTLTLVDAAGGTTAGAFTLSPDTVNAGFARYALNYDALGNDFYLSASEGFGLFQMLKVNEGAQALWRQSADAWSARTASLRDPAKDGVEQGRLWAQFYSSADERDQAYAASSGDYDLSYRQKHVGGQVGADLGTIGGVTYGLTGGYLASALTFAGTEDRTDYDAYNLGAYAQGQWGNYFVNALAKYDVFGAKIDSVTGGFTEKLDGTAFGLQLEAGARFGDASFFLEPVASLAYSRTSLDTLEVLGAAVDFDSANSLRGKVGARIGGTAPVGNGVATFYLGAHLVNEFEGKDGVRFVNGATSALANDPIDAYGQFQLGATLVSGTGLNGFAEGTASIGNDYQSYGGRLGVRMAF
ncbi:autotransporter domain-containing protein [Hoeflea sp. 108]|uniref:autotransporter domain-containing protein n=1 Tax=Hoeflea sp. 108 TaxID=1116369 RepID=UPI0003803CDF|nr:autotransporter domain-containing protein [Hoeflea sp. 108]